MRYADKADVREYQRLLDTYGIPYDATALLGCDTYGAECVIGVLISFGAKARINKEGQPCRSLNL